VWTHENAIDVVPHLVRNASQGRSDHGYACGKRFEHDERTCFEQLRWHRKGVVLGQARADLGLRNCREQADSRIGSDQRQHATARDGVRLALHDPEDVQAHGRRGSGAKRTNENLCALGRVEPAEMRDPNDAVRRPRPEVRPRAA